MHVNSHPTTLAVNYTLRPHLMPVSVLGSVDVYSLFADICVQIRVEATHVVHQICLFFFCKFASTLAECSGKACDFLIF